MLESSYLSVVLLLLSFFSSLSTRFVFSWVMTAGKDCCCNCRKVLFAVAALFLFLFSSQSFPFFFLRLLPSSFSFFFILLLLGKKRTPCKGISILPFSLFSGGEIELRWKRKGCWEMYKAVWDALVKSLMLTPVWSKSRHFFHSFFLLRLQQRKKETRFKWWRCCRDSVLWGIWKIIRFDSYLFSLLWGFSHISCRLSLIRTSAYQGKDLEGTEPNFIRFWTRFLFSTPFIPWNSLVSNACWILLSDNETQMFLQSVDKDESKSVRDDCLRE